MSDPARHSDTRILNRIATHAVLQLDVHGRIVDWRAASETIFGYCKDDVVGRPFALLFIEEDRQKGLPELELKSAAESGESNDDRWHLRKDGGRIWAFGSVTPLRNDAGELTGFVKILRDATDFKTRLEAMERRAEFLELRDRQKNGFVAALAHDLRHPLLVFNFGIETIRMTLPDETRISKPLENMSKELEFAQNLVSQLMDDTVHAHGEVELAREVVSFQDLIREVAAGFPPSPTVELQLLMPDAPLYVNVDPVRMRQVVTNLLQNAFKFTEQGHIWVKLGLEGEDVALRVHETGCGISAEFMPHLFELFTQAHPPATTRTGIGLGLSLVRDIVRLHGGTIEALSGGLGKGSIFTIRLAAASPPKGVP